MGEICVIYVDDMVIFAYSGRELVSAHEWCWSACNAMVYMRKRKKPFVLPHKLTGAASCPASGVRHDIARIDWLLSLRRPETRRAAFFLATVV